MIILMMMRQFYHVIIITLVSTIIFSEATLGQDREKRGWNWYEDPVEVVEEDDSKIAKEPIIPPHEHLKKMTPAAIGELMDEQLAFAIVSEEVGEVAEYFQLMDFARKRSKTFTALTAQALLFNPKLNARSAYPVTNAGRTIVSKERKEIRDRRLINERGDFAIVMFSAKGCNACNVQWGTLQAFEDRTGWNISKMDIHQYPDRAARFNVEVTPTTFIIQKNTKNYFPVSVGLESLPAIADNAYRAVRLLRKEITPGQFLNGANQDGGFFDPGVTSGFEGGE